MNLLMPAYLLCGGGSKRFGSDKALALINGRKVIEIIIEELRKVFPSIYLVTSGDDKYSFTGIECIKDIYAGRGPLAGIHAALNHSSYERVFIISCDMPLITGEAMEYIAGYSTQKNAVIPFSGGRNHYMCAVYGKSLAHKAGELLESTSSQLKSAGVAPLVKASDAEIINFDSLPQFNPKIFFNLNTIEDLNSLS